MIYYSNNEKKARVAILILNNAIQENEYFEV